MPAPSSRVANLRAQLALVLLITLARRHLAREDARSDCVHANLAVLERRRQHAAQVRECRFRGSVRELAVGATLHCAGDGRNVDHLRGVAGRDFAALGEEREEGHAHEVLRRDIRAVSVHPLLVLGAEEVLADGFWVGHLGLAVGGCCLLSACGLPHNLVTSFSTHRTWYYRPSQSLHCSPASARRPPSVPDPWPAARSPPCC